MMSPSAETIAIRSADGTDLHAHLRRGKAPRGIVVISHGMGEHSGCYDDLALTLAATPGLADVVSFDYRGHGLSPGRRGAVGRYDDYVADLRAAIARAKTLRPGSPVFLLGHSNGGLVALHVALEDRGDLAGLILSNPSLRIAARVPRHKYYAGRFLLRFAPGVTLKSTVLDEHLTRDPANLAQRKSDHLRHSRISAPTFFGMVEGGARLEGLAPLDPRPDAHAHRRVRPRDPAPPDPGILRAARIARQDPQGLPRDAPRASQRGRPRGCHRRDRPMAR